MGILKNRYIALYVENEVGVLAKVSGLFSAKSYNLQSLTVGRTEHEDISRMTISVSADDVTFEQIKKQLNRMVEVIKVVDLTEIPTHMKELLFAKIKRIDESQKEEAFRIAETFSTSSPHAVQVIDIGTDSVMLQSTLTERRNDDLVRLLRETYKHIDVVRGGSVAMEGISTSCR
ncbi:MAG: acetolactate synthase small subunit [Lachnospiraceae bacterium]|nr:acetolactate synthase small subunit [Lachnospiraceae bacterium]